jgi:uncharacterized SAM-binding protein YcdF (DUF218 family)
MYRLTAELLRPYTLAVLLSLVAAVVLVCRKQSSRRWLITLAACLAILALLSMRAVGSLFLASLEWRYPPSDRPVTMDDTLVVLSGGMSVAQGRAELGADTAVRCIWALRLYREAGHCRMVLCGGVLHLAPDGPPVAEVMRDFMVDAGVNPADILVEDKSLTTYENATNAGKLLDDRHVSRIVLVTDATHMLRASRCFEKLGFEVIPAPCRFQAPDITASLTEILPSAEGVEGTQTAFHEWIGTFWYWLKGRI